MLLGELGTPIPLDTVRCGDLILKAGIRDVTQEVEEGDLPLGTVPLALGSGLDNVARIVLVHEVHHLFSRVAREIEGPALDQRLDDAAVRL